MKKIIGILFMCLISSSSFAQISKEAKEQLIVDNVKALTSLVDLDVKQQKGTYELLELAYRKYDFEGVKDAEYNQELTRMLKGRFEAFLTKGQFKKFENSKELYKRIIAPK